MTTLFPEKVGAGTLGHPVNHEPDLGLEEVVSSKTFWLRLGRKQL